MAGWNGTICKPELEGCVGVFLFWEFESLMELRPRFSVLMPDWKTVV